MGWSLHASCLLVLLILKTTLSTLTPDGGGEDDIERNVALDGLNMAGNGQIVDHHDEEMQQQSHFPETRHGRGENSAIITDRRTYHSRHKRQADNLRTEGESSALYPDTTSLDISESSGLLSTIPQLTEERPTLGQTSVSSGDSQIGDPTAATLTSASTTGVDYEISSNSTSITTDITTTSTTPLNNTTDMTTTTSTSPLNSTTETKTTTSTTRLIATTDMTTTISTTPLNTTTDTATTTSITPSNATTGLPTAANTTTTNTTTTETITLNTTSLDTTTMATPTFSTPSVNTTVVTPISSTKPSDTTTNITTTVSITPSNATTDMTTTTSTTPLNTTTDITTTTSTTQLNATTDMTTINSITPLNTETDMTRTTSTTPLNTEKDMTTTTSTTPLNATTYITTTTSTTPLDTETDMITTTSTTPLNTTTDMTTTSSTTPLNTTTDMTTITSTIPLNTTTVLTTTTSTTPLNTTTVMTSTISTTLISTTTDMSTTFSTTPLNTTTDMSTTSSTTTSNATTVMTITTSTTPLNTTTDMSTTFSTTPLNTTTEMSTTSSTTTSNATTYMTTTAIITPLNATTDMSTTTSTTPLNTATVMSTTFSTTPLNTTTEMSTTSSTTTSNATTYMTTTAIITPLNATTDMSTTTSTTPLNTATVMITTTSTTPLNTTTDITTTISATPANTTTDMTTTSARPLNATTTIPSTTQYTSPTLSTLTTTAPSDTTTTTTFASTTSPYPSTIRTAVSNSTLTYSTIHSNISISTTLSTTSSTLDTAKYSTAMFSTSPPDDLAMCSPTTVNMTFLETDTNQTCNNQRVTCNFSKDSLPPVLGDSSLPFALSPTENDGHVSLQVCTTDSLFQKVGDYELSIENDENTTINISVTWYIRVEDVNQPPKFSQDKYEFSVDENAPTGSDLATVQVTNGTNSTANTGKNVIILLDEDIYNYTYTVKNIYTITSVRIFILSENRYNDTIPSPFHVRSNTIWINGTVQIGLVYNMTLMAIDGGDLTGKTTIIVNVIDVNDPPFCRNNISSTNISLLTPVGTAIYRAECTDRDTNGTFSALTYHEYNVSDFEYFSISENGTVFLQQLLPVTKSQLTYSVYVQDGGGLVAKFTLAINVSRDFPPTCQPNNLTLTFKKTDASCHSDILMCRNNEDLSSRLQLNFTIVSNQTLFRLSHSTNATNVISVCPSSNLSQQVGQYSWSIRVSNELGSVSVPLTLNVEDVNEPPAFENASYSYSALENVTIGTTIASVFLNKTSGTPGDIRCYDPNTVGNFSIQRVFISSILTEYANGSKTSATPPVQLLPDRLVWNASIHGTVQHVVRLTVEDRGGLNGSTLVNITVKDVNEPPVCDLVLPVNLDLLTQIGQNLSVVKCSDPDFDILFKTLDYSSAKYYNYTYFNVSTSGEVTLAALIPRNARELKLTIVAQDGGGLESNLTVLFNIQSNYPPICAPVFLPPKVWRKDQCFRVYPHCQDPVSKDNSTLTYNFTGNFLAAFKESASPRNSTYREFCYMNSTNGTFDLTLDISNGLGVFEWNTSVNVYYFLAVPVFSQLKYDVMVYETAPVGQSVLTVNATVSNSSVLVVYSLIGQDDFSYFFGINNVTGVVTVLTNLSLKADVILQADVWALDPETGVSNSVPLSIKVQDVNQPPACAALIVNSTVLWNLTQGSIISRLNCTDPDTSQNFSRLVYRTNANSTWTVNSSNGEISLKSRGQLDPNVGLYWFHVSVSDGYFPETVQVYVYVDRTPPIPILNISIDGLKATLLWMIDSVYNDVISSYTILVRYENGTEKSNVSAVNTSVYIITDLQPMQNYSVQIIVNGLSADVTSKRIPFSTGAVPLLVFAVDLPVIINMPWKQEFLNRSSNAFTNLQNQMNLFANNRLTVIPGYVGTSVRSFRLNGYQVYMDIVTMFYEFDYVTPFYVEREIQKIFPGAIIFSGDVYITNQSVSVDGDIRANENVTAYCTARTVGIDPPKFQWTLPSSVVADNSSNFITSLIKGANDSFLFTNQLKIIQIRPQDTGVLVCKISGSGNYTNISTTVNVTINVLVTNFSASLNSDKNSVLYGSDVSLTCRRVSGYKSLWQAQLFRLLENGSWLLVDKRNQSEDSQDAVFRQQNLTVNTKYHCRARDLWSLGTSPNVTIFVLELAQPEIMANLSNIQSNFFVVENATISATCITTAVGVTQLSFQWTMPGALVSSGPQLVNSWSNFNSSQVIENMKLSEDGTLSCRVSGTGEYASVSRSAQININVVSKMRARLSTKSGSVNEGSDVNLICKRTFDYTDTWNATLYTVQNGKELISVNTSIQNTTDAYFTVKNVTTNTTFECEIRDSIDVARSSRLTVFVLRAEQKRCKVDGQWPDTPAGETISIACPEGYGSAGGLVRKCATNGEWEEADSTACVRTDILVVKEYIDKIRLNTSVKSTDELVDLLANATTNVDLLQGDVKNTVDILNSISNISINGTSVPKENEIKKYMAVADNLLQVPSNVWKNQTDQAFDLFQSLDTMGKYATRQLDNSSLEDVAPVVTDKIVLYVNRTGSTDILFPDRELKNGANLSWASDKQASVFLPKEIFSEIPMKYSALVLRNFSNVLADQVATDENKGDNSSLLINSPIMSVTLTRFDVSLAESNGSLKKPAILTFKHLTNLTGKATCRYLITSSNTVEKWSENGCIVDTTNDTVTVCRCIHLTNFAILMSPYRSTGPDAKVLDYLSIIGISISIFFLFVTIIFYFVLWKYVKSDRSVILVNLCVVLLLADVTFLAGVDHTEKPIPCKVVAALLHYLFLTMFFLNLCEGLDIFISIVIVFPIKSVLTWLLVMAYGVPLIVVAVSLGIRLDGYGGQDSCWLSLDGGLLWAFVGPGLAALCANFFFVFVVMRTLAKSTTLVTRNARERTKSIIKAICVVTPILGLTWIFGVFSVNQETIVFQYLFLIFNSLQGLFIFIFHCILSQQVREGIRSKRRRYRARSSAGDASSKYVSQKQTSESTVSHDNDRKPSPFLQADQHMQRMSGKLDSSDDYSRDSPVDVPEDVLVNVYNSIYATNPTDINMNGRVEDDHVTSGACNLRTSKVKLKQFHLSGDNEPQEDYQFSLDEVYGPGARISTGSDEKMGWSFKNVFRSSDRHKSTELSPFARPRALYSEDQRPKELRKSARMYIPMKQPSTRTYGYDQPSSPVRLDTKAESLKAHEHYYPLGGAPGASFSGNSSSETKQPPRVASKPVRNHNPWAL